MNNYYENPAVSQSKLKLLINNPALFNAVEEPELYFEEKKHFIIGSAVDCLLTEGREVFENKYHLSEVENKPSDTIKSIINMLFDALLEEFNIEEIESIHNNIYRPIILQCCNTHNYQSRWNDDTRVNKIIEHYEYFEDLKLAFGKQVLSQEEYDLISTVEMSIRTNIFTSNYFNKKDVKFQVPIYFEYEGVECKALLDMVIFYHDDKKIQPLDIKTMGDYVINFPKSLRRRRYDIQAAFYVEALKWLYPDYEILPFKFIVESTIEPGTPIVYTIDEALLELGKFGRPEVVLSGNVLTGEKVFYSRVEEIKGFHQLIELYKYYDTNGFELDQKVRENSGELTIDWSGIIV